MTGCLDEYGKALLLDQTGHAENGEGGGQRRAVGGESCKIDSVMDQDDLRPGARGLLLKVGLVEFADGHDEAGRIDLSSQGLLVDLLLENVRGVRRKAEGNPRDL